MKPFRIASFVIFSISCAWLLAQTSATPAFEVASIKPAPPLQNLVAQIQSGKLRLGMNIDGARVDINFVSLSGLITAAYRVKQFQIVGPDWLRSQYFEIHATIPEGATKDQVPEMLQALLAERFKLSAHRENKEQPVYALVVSKGGAKLKEAEEAEPAPPAEDSAKTSSGSNEPGKGTVSVSTPEGQVNIKPEARGVTISGGRTGKMRITMGENGAMRMEISKITMAEFTDLLTPLMDRPAVNMTDLKGSYQVSLEIPMTEIINLARTLAPDLALGNPSLGALGGAASSAGGLAGIAASDPTGGALFHAVQQLGLKLESRKAPVETLIIDHIEKTPTEN
jgi:uncharacterized protein (TIGR03435 family)